MNVHTFPLDPISNIDNQQRLCSPGKQAFAGKRHHGGGAGKRTAITAILWRAYSLNGTIPRRKALFAFMESL